MEKHITPTELNENLISLIQNDWMLITAGNRKKCNTMTASYGGFGILFGKRVAQIYVRPERYTDEFLENEGYFSLSFFDETHRKHLQYCGKTSGRDEDKIAACGLTTQFSAEGIPYFNESRLTILCKKIYVQSLDPALILDSKITQTVYGSGGVHKMYVGEIIDVFYH